MLVAFCSLYESVVNLGILEENRWGLFKLHLIRSNGDMLKWFNIIRFFVLGGWWLGLWIISNARCANQNMQSDII